MPIYNVLDERFKLPPWTKPPKPKPKAK